MRFESESANRTNRDVPSLIRPALVAVTILITALSLVTTALICKLILHRSRTGIDRAAEMLNAIDRPSAVLWTDQELLDTRVILQARRSIAERLSSFRKASDELIRGVEAAKADPANALKFLQDSVDRASRISESGQNLFRP